MSCPRRRKFRAEEGDEGGRGPNCIICLDDLQAGQVVATGRDCVQHWCHRQCMVLQAAHMIETFDVGGFG